MKKFLIFGSKGQLGRTFQEHFENKKIRYSCIDRNKINFKNNKLIEKKISDFKPSVIINCAAFTNVDGAEKLENKKKANFINNLFIEFISNLSQKYNILLVHFSTDYIFGGNQKNKWTEKDIANPINYYGKTKLAGEEKIKNSKCNFLIIRISWLISQHRTNFLIKILSLIRKEKTLKIIDDQYGSPTSCSWVVKCTMKLIKLKIKNHIFHVSSKGKTSWFNIGKLILKNSKKRPKNIRLERIKSKNFNQLAKRPKNSYLSTKKFENFTGLSSPNWKSEVKIILKKLSIKN